jgi:hypothetical protein
MALLASFRTVTATRIHANLPLGSAAVKAIPEALPAVVIFV